MEIFRIAALKVKLLAASDWSLSQSFVYDNTLQCSEASNASTLPGHCPRFRMSLTAILASTRASRVTTIPATWTRRFSACSHSQWCSTRSSTAAGGRATSNGMRTSRARCATESSTRCESKPAPYACALAVLSCRQN